MQPLLQRGCWVCTALPHRRLSAGKPAPSRGISESPDPLGTSAAAAGPRGETRSCRRSAGGRGALAASLSPARTQRREQRLPGTSAEGRKGRPGRGCSAETNGGGCGAMWDPFRTERRRRVLPRTDALAWGRFGSGWGFVCLFAYLFVFSALSGRERSSLPTDGGGEAEPGAGRLRAEGTGLAGQALGLSGRAGRLREGSCLTPRQVLSPSECQAKRQWQLVPSDGRRRQLPKKRRGWGLQLCQRPESRGGKGRLR